MKWAATDPPGSRPAQRTPVPPFLEELFAAASRRWPRCTWLPPWPPRNLLEGRASTRRAACRQHRDRPVATRGGGRPRGRAAFRPRRRALATLTLHRRENYGHGLDTACAAVLDLLAAAPDLDWCARCIPIPPWGRASAAGSALTCASSLTAPMDYRPSSPCWRSRSSSSRTRAASERSAVPRHACAGGAREHRAAEAVAPGRGDARAALRRERIPAEAQRLLAAPRLRPFAFDAAVAPFGNGRAASQALRTGPRHARRLPDPSPDP